MTASSDLLLPNIGWNHYEENVKLFYLFSMGILPTHYTPRANFGWWWSRIVGFGLDILANYYQPLYLACLKVAKKFVLVAQVGGLYLICRIN